MNRLAFVLGSRGLKNTVARTLQVVRRFGIGPERMERRLMRYVDIVAAYNARPSLPITASVLDRNPQVAQRLVDHGAELCVHGLFHNDLSKLRDEEQRDQIAKAVEIFTRHGIAFRGFRSPYLRHNSATLAAVEDLGFDYDSNLPFYWQPHRSLNDLSPMEEDWLERGLRFYRPVTYPQQSSLPRMIGRIVEIPVSLPDDEILLDRMGLSPARIAEVWTEMLQMALERGELLTIQLHPERLEILAEALKHVLEVASTEGVWIASMAEISSWWRKRTEVEVEVVRADDGSFQLVNCSIPDLTFHLYDPASAKLVAIESGKPFESRAIPLIGLDARVEPDLIHNLRQLGYPFEIAEDTTKFNLFIEHGSKPEDFADLLRHARGPLLRAATWPRTYRAAMCVTGDIDCLTLGDFVRRFREA